MWRKKLNTQTLFSLATIYTPSLVFKENVSVLVYKKLLVINYLCSNHSHFYKKYHTFDTSLVIIRCAAFKITCLERLYMSYLLVLVMISRTQSTELPSTSPGGR